MAKTSKTSRRVATSNTPVAKRRRTSAINVGDKVVIKSSHLRPKKGEVFEVVDIVLVTIQNDQRRVMNIHVSNLDRVLS